MKILLTTLNSKYIHSAPALYYLYESLGAYKKDATLKEFTINQELEYIFGEIGNDYEVVFFSCYIWNIEMTLKLVEQLKKGFPDIHIVLGGPEVSFERTALYQKCSYVDYIHSGEGESFIEPYLESLEKGRGWDSKEASGLMRTPVETIPFPYETKLPQGKILYYESSRGCPFNCSYCISSTTKGVVYWPLDRIKKELAYLVSLSLNQIKFVDRTFNANPKRALEIFNYLAEIDDGTINFHFEIGGDLIDAPTLKFLKTIRPGLIQFEIGLQTINIETLKACDRVSDLVQLKENIKQLIQLGTLHIHCDLIFGLPKEDYEGFKSSFNQLYELQPHMLQLGFLKLLKGSKLRSESNLYGYTYMETPPYEFITNNIVSAQDKIQMKQIEHMVDKYYNSGMFQATLRYAISCGWADAFSFYESLAKYWYAQGYHHVLLKKDKLYSVLKDFLKTNNYLNQGLIEESLAFDYLKSSQTSVSYQYWKTRKSESSFNEHMNALHETLQDQTFKESRFPQWESWPVKDVLKKINFGWFRYDWETYVKVGQLEHVNPENLNEEGLNIWVINKK